MDPKLEALCGMANKQWAASHPGDKGVFRRAVNNVILAGYTQELQGARKPPPPPPASASADTEVSWASPSCTCPR